MKFFKMNNLLIKIKINFEPIFGPVGRNGLTPNFLAKLQWTWFIQSDLAQHPVRLRQCNVKPIFR